MMGPTRGDQHQFFHLFNLEDRIPKDHYCAELIRSWRKVLADLHEKLASFYRPENYPARFLPSHKLSDAY